MPGSSTKNSFFVCQTKGPKKAKVCVVQLLTLGIDCRTQYPALNVGGGSAKIVGSHRNDADNDFLLLRDAQNSEQKRNTFATDRRTIEPKNELDRNSERSSG